MILRSTLAALVLATTAHADSYPDATAVVSVGGPVTEVIFALGEEDRIAARDTTSVFPAEALTLPDVGYMRRLSAEGVLSVAPDLIIARDTSGPQEAIEQLKAAAIPIVFTEDGFSGEAVLQNVRTVGEALGVEDKAESLAASIEQDLGALALAVSGLGEKRKVMFVLSLDGGRLNVAGRDTGADGIITLAGGENVMAGDFSGYKLVDSEAVITAAPDLILMMDGRGNHASRKDDVLALPSVALTPAGAAGALETIPGAALSFGPRTAMFGQQLFELFYQSAG